MKAGIYDDMANAAYHAETDWLSATQLKAYIPEMYTPPTGRDALDVGSALHSRVLGTDEQVDVHDFPTWRSKAAEEARACSDEAGAIPILAADSERIDAMVASLREHPAARSLLWEMPGRSEVSVFAEDDEGRQFKCRPDRLLDGGLIVDLKSTSAKPGRRNTAMTVMDYGYDLAAAHYLETAALAGLEPTGFAFVFVAKADPHRVTVVELGDLLDDGYALRDLALRRATHQSHAYEGAEDYLTLHRPFRREIPA